MLYQSGTIHNICLNQSAADRAATISRLPKQSGTDRAETIGMTADGLTRSPLSYSGAACHPTAQHISHPVGAVWLNPVTVGEYLTDQ